MLASRAAAVGLVTADTTWVDHLLAFLPDVADPGASCVAGALHNASHLGGALGLPVAAVIAWRKAGA